MFSFARRRIYVKKAKQAVATWEQEFQDKGWPVGNIYNSVVISSGIANATQMVYSFTGQVGCGAQKCGSKVVVICQYKGPAVLDQPIYQIGATCSRCPDFHVCQQATGLCIQQNVG